MATFMLEITTPDRVFLKEEVDMVILRSVEGDIGIMANHVPLVTPLSIGEIRIKKDGSIRIAAMASGFVSVTKDKVAVLVDSAEWPQEIDKGRALAAKERALANLKKDTIDTTRAEAALKRAVNRINVSSTM